VACSLAAREHRERLRPLGDQFVVGAVALGPPVHQHALDEDLVQAFQQDWTRSTEGFIAAFRKSIGDDIDYPRFVELVGDMALTTPTPAPAGAQTAELNSHLEPTVT
jgi:hypothetical protein